MKIFDTWFDIGPSDSDSVLNFLQDLPGKIKVFIQEDNSNFLIQLKIAESQFVNEGNFRFALKEASEQLFSNLAFERFHLNSENYRQFFQAQLNIIGFSNFSLRLKAENLNFLWRRLKKKVDQKINGIIDFTNKHIVKALRRFLQFLNSILGSLIKVIPGAEAIKEIKEIIESFVAIGDD